MTQDLAPYAHATQVGRLADWISADVFTPLPDDWEVFVTDVEQSTQAIAAGQYKEVNALGAACIVAVTNACGQDGIPFTFGGDGAVVVVPPSLHEAVGAALIGLRERAISSSGLRLRVGCVPIHVIRARGADLLVAKRRMSAGFEIALFSGGGLSLADDLVKSAPDAYRVTVTSNEVPSVQGLECRWNDVPSRHGRIMTLLVKARQNDLAPLRELLQEVERIMPHANPVRHDNLPLTWPPQHLWTEIRLKYGQAMQRLLHYAGIWALTGLFSRVVQKQAGNPQSAAGKYIAGLVDNTDHIKLDDVFRAVLDVSDEEARQLEQLLARLQAAGMLDYGVHYSSHALMTCFVRSMENHVHSVDGGDGGYVMAARQLKERLKLPG